MKKLRFIVLIVLMFMMACTGKDKGVKPATFLTEQQMVDVLTDSYLIEAELNQRKSMGEEVSKLEEAYYRQLFVHYGITDSIFDENMAYYTTQLGTLERIMDSVKLRITSSVP